ncbi:MAG: MFS transporter [Planctomycetes bacterium]|nr:MFS transporter [Planctomycetota bacterium]
MSRRPRLPGTVYALGFVSFCTDLGSEMIVPLLPALFASLGAGMLQLGLLQGISDLLVAFLRIASGWLSDRQQRRVPWLLFGYGLSTLMRPLFALVQGPWQALAVRAADRVGKGLRSAPRDALIADVVEPAQRGRAFGVQRALDHAGAMCGALLASLLVYLGMQVRTVFAWSLLPGLGAVLLIALAVREPAPRQRPVEAGPAPGSTRQLTPFLLVVGLAAVASVIDLFVIARALELGAAPAALPLLWALLHLVRSTFAAPLGALSDRWGRRAVIGVGLLGQVLVLVGFALTDSLPIVWLLGAVLGLHAAFTEGAERGFVADLVGSKVRGRGFGAYYCVHGLASFGGAALVGWSWDRFGAGAGFAVAAAATGLAGLVLLLFVRGPVRAAIR